MTYKPLAPLAAALALLAAPVAAQMAIPTDVQDSCSVAPADFSGWFQDGAPSADGVVKAANSVTFPTTNTVCDFYTWGAQMFLWLTSPAEMGRVLDSPAIFNVLPVDANGDRYFQENDTGAALNFALRAEKQDDIGEVGQAGSSGVLVSQAGGLVYYGVHVNDVYGYFLTGQKDGALAQTEFPRNQQDLSDIQTYMAKTFPNETLVAPDTLVMELKSSWVEADTVADVSQFVTIEATVPTYTANADNSTWTQGPPKSTTLALAGLHIVGTVQNHPEFVWITYEHITNAPDGNYYYMNTAGDVVEQAFSSDGEFLFMARNAPEPQNIECAKASKSDIVATTLGSGATACDGGIVASNTYRQYPWGSAKDDKSTATVTNNTSLLSVNASIRSQLSAGDVRANYIQTGGIWTSAASATADAPIPSASGYTNGDLRGSLFAFNGTMETYTQGTHCFSCHAVTPTSPNSFQPFELSHIYSQIKQLTVPKQ
ncbi:MULTISPECIES: hypothetical protein [unclassified Marinovum]